MLKAFRLALIRSYAKITDKLKHQIYLYSRSELQGDKANKEVIGLSDKIKEVRVLSDKIMMTVLSQ